MILFVKVIQTASVLIICALILYLPFYDTQSLFKSYVTEKVFLFFAVTGILIFLKSIMLVLSFPKDLRFKLTWLDLALLLFVLYLILNRVFISEMEGMSLKFIQLIGLSVFYFIMRFTPAKYYPYFIFSLLISGIIQGVYGNLQIYGIYPSNHHIFNITGSFFNPGPYSGYLALIFPIALAIYLSERKTYSSNYPGGNKVAGLLLNQSEANWKVRINEYSKQTILHYKAASQVIVRFKNFRNLSVSLLNHPETIIKIKHYLTGFLSILAIITILLVIPATRSRASWLAIIVSSAYIVLNEYSIPGRFLSYLRTKTRKILAGVGLTIFIGAMLSGIYFFKKDSADGRLLIWKVSSGMIKDKPLLGHGFEKFQADYMHYQAAYFEDDPDNPESYVADDIIYPFNEYVKILVESGLSGFALLCLILILVFHPASPNKSDVYSLATRAGILGISVFSFFSYPAEILPVLVSLVMLLAILAEKYEPVRIKMLPIKWNENRTVPIIRISLTWVLTALMAYMYFPSKSLYKAYFSWDEGNQIYRMEAYQECLESFDESFDALKNNGEYLIMYGKALTMAGEYNKAIEVLQRAGKYQKNTILYTALGDSYKQVERYEDAGKAYTKAYFMIPSRFYAPYLLARLYDETGQHDKALATATELINKKEKIPSTAIEEIKGELRKMLEKHYKKQK